MKKTYKMENLECAACAGKMESDIGKLPGVERVRVNYLLQKITLEAHECALQELLPKADAICKSYERHCRIVY